MAGSGAKVGLDIGSRSMKMVVWQDGHVADQSLTKTTFDPLPDLRRMLEQAGSDTVFATGHGRDLCRHSSECPQAEIVSTVGANVRGARHIAPSTRSILDIGALETLIIAVTPAGEVYNYELSSQCAAGTGKYLEFMADSMKMPLEELGDFALQADRRITMESQCTVFAEREAMFMVAQGEKPQNIAMALHMSIVEKTLETLERTGARPPLLLVGGLAHNKCIKMLLEERLAAEILVPENPDYVGALGAVLHGEYIH